MSLRLYGTKNSSSSLFPVLFSLKLRHFLWGSELPSTVFVILNRQQELLVSAAAAFSVTIKKFIDSANASILKHHVFNNVTNQGLSSV